MNLIRREKSFFQRIPTEKNDEVKMEDLEYRDIELINTADILSLSINRVLKTKYSNNFIKIICIPYLAHLDRIIEHSNISNNDKVFKNFAEFYKFYWGSLFYGNTFAFEKKLKFEDGSYDVVFTSKINYYEKIIYKLYNIKYKEIEYSQEIYEVKTEIKKIERIKLAEELITNNILKAKHIVDNLPITLFEELTIKEEIIYPNTKVLWLGQIHNENYLFYLASQKERGARVIGQPHGGAFGQMESEFGNEQAERLLSDEYSIPEWSLQKKQLPNQRVSRNIFINIKNYKFLKKNNKKTLVILSFFIEDDHITNKLFFKKGITHISYFNKLLNNLDLFFKKDKFDFKMHPHQKDSKSKFEYLKTRYPESELIYKNNLNNVARDYDKVIHFEPWATSILELCSTKINQYVYLDDGTRISDNFKNFIEETKNKICSEEIDDGCFVMINNREFKEAYNASIGYPFFYASRIKELKEKMK
jgi:hypothetical protein